MIGSTRIIKGPRLLREYLADVSEVLCPAASAADRLAELPVMSCWEACCCCWLCGLNALSMGCCLVGETSAVVAGMPLFFFVESSLVGEMLVQVLLLS